MTKVIIIAILLLILLFVRSKINSARGIPALKATIKLCSESYYVVNFEKLTSNQNFHSIEYVRLILCYVARALYIIGSQREFMEDQQTLLFAIKTIAQTDLTKTESIADLLEEDFVIRDADIPMHIEAETIEIETFYQNPVDRSCKTKIPERYYPLQYSRALIALMEVSLGRINNNQKNKLRGSLAQMLDLYQSQYSISSLEASYIVPTKSFMESKLS